MNLIIRKIIACTLVVVQFICIAGRIEVNGIQYVYYENAWTNVGTTQQLTGAVLRNHFTRIAQGVEFDATNDTLRHLIPRNAVLQELGRMLLAQNLWQHNLYDNGDFRYMTVANHQQDLDLIIKDLREHLLLEKHLGYFPLIQYKVYNTQQRSWRWDRWFSPGGLNRPVRTRADRSFTQSPVDDLDDNWKDGLVRKGIFDINQAVYDRGIDK